MDLTVSHNGAKTYEACPKKYNAIYNLEYERSDPSISQQLGSLIHDGLARCLINGGDMKDTLPFMMGLEEYSGSYVNDAIEIVDFVNKQLGLGKDIVPYLYDGNFLVEFEVEVPLGGYLFNGRPDAVVEMFDSVVLIDWKTRSQFYDPDIVFLDRQLFLYAYALRDMGVNVDAICQMQIRSTPPGRVALTRKKQVNKSMRKTLLDIYIDDLEFLGIDLHNEEVSNFNYLKSKGKFENIEYFIKPIYPMFNDSLIDYHADNMAHTIEAISNDTFWRGAHIDTVCKWCHLRDRCPSF